MIPGPLLFRADASIAIGTGHVMRCLAFAQAWEDLGGRSLFAMVESTRALAARLRSESCEVVSVAAPTGSQEDSERTAALAREHHATWVVVDGYQFGADYQQALKSRGLKVLFMDDYGHGAHYSAEVVVNPNVCANEALYKSRESYTRVLLGTRYCILRREFNAWRQWQRTIPPLARRVLVTMGGSDPENLTARVLEALSSSENGHRFEHLEATVVIGGSNPRSVSLEQLAEVSGRKIRLHKDTAQMAEWMAEADVAISAAGSTSWELCLTGLPSLLVDVAANQTAVARELDRKGCAIHLGSSSEFTTEKIADQLDTLVHSQELRQSLSRTSRALVDGYGSMRIASVLSGEGFFLRRATADDSRLLWEWANDPAVRSSSFSPSPILWETHQAWFADKLRQEKCLILIAEDEEGSPVGQIRFDTRPDGDCEVDVSVAPAKRGQGLGATLIRRGVETALKEERCPGVHAFVRRNNDASRRAFESAGFSNLGEEDVNGHSALHYVCTRQQSRV
jgi:UDP-2,4-diacetamido-2,4,6-trideoxy-beta-L-altropyranose hydrolase